ncbi:MAG: hypothetical protein JWP00_460 [Chloroflexi bacterium]|jgi:DNA polymerase V|nr:hypothetical protein [Chloroflexota bacterium]
MRELSEMWITDVYQYQETGRFKRLQIPLFGGTVPAGFPSPADDYMEMKLDLNELCIQHPVATFFMRVQGLSMTGAGIQPGDLLVVDRALEAQDGSIVIALVDGEFTVKRLRKDRANRIVLQAENPDFPPIVIKEGMYFEVWGVVVSTIHFFSQNSPLLPKAAKQIR